MVSKQRASTRRQSLALLRLVGVAGAMQASCGAGVSRDPLAESSWTSGRGGNGVGGAKAGSAATLGGMAGAEVGGASGVELAGSTGVRGGAVGNGGASDDPSVGGDAAAGNGDDVPCDVSMEFGLPSRILGLLPGSSRVRLSPDERTAYFSYPVDEQNTRIAFATRPDKTSPFSESITEDALQVPGAKDLSPSVPAAALSLYFESPRSGKWQLYQSTRSSIVDSFSTPTLLLGQGFQDAVNGGPYVLPDDSALYFHNETGDICRAERVGVGFAYRTVIAEIATASIESFPVVSPDELTLYFQSNRPGGKGNYDMWVASRSSKSSPFGEAVPLKSLNTAGFDIPSWISADACRLYFERTEGDWLGAQAYVVERKRPGAAR